MPFEIRAVSSLALLYAVRMLGLFMVLPVLALYADQYAGATAASLGLALGIYGLAQAALQIPLGWASDIVGRKPIIVMGLLVFAAGSLLAAHADSIGELILGRALQGSGAIAGAVMALLADLTKEENRTKAMAVVGASIGVSFTVAIILGPWIASFGGMSGVFNLSALLACVGILVVLVWVPRVSKTPAIAGVETKMVVRKIDRNALRHCFVCGELWRLNFGIFCLHAVLMASFIVLPSLIEARFALPATAHWQIYLPTLLGGFVVMVPMMRRVEKAQMVPIAFVVALSILLLSFLILGLTTASASVVFVVLFLFFVAFNYLEASLPSLVSKSAPQGARGTAMGMFSTSQFLGAFSGGAIGGQVLQLYSPAAVFVLTAFLVGIWLLLHIFALRQR